MDEKFFNEKHPDICAEKEKLLKHYLFTENIKRSKIFARIVILFEVLLIVYNMFSNYLAVQQITVNFHLLMYIILLGTSILLLLYVEHFEKLEKPTTSQEQRAWKVLAGFVIFFLVWGVGIALADQQEYGNVMAFAVNIMCISILFHASNKRIIQLYAIPVSLLVVGLPFFQTSPEILVGHYINLTVFLFFCWLASRMLYQNDKANFYNKLLLTETNNNLAQTIEKNNEINRELEEANIRLHQLASMDELTEVPNRRGLQQYIEETLKTVAGKKVLSFIMIDIDEFKSFNDNYGHFEGDKVLQNVAKNINKCVKSSGSFVSRFGGEEFIIAAFDRTPEEVIKLAECIRESVEEAAIPHEFSPVADCVTISVGIAMGVVETEEQIELLKTQADFSLYKAKSNGKNQVDVSQEKSLICNEI